MGKRRGPPVGAGLCGTRDGLSSFGLVAEQVARLLPAQAFAAGRDFEREYRRTRRSRRQFVECWAKTKKKLAA